MNKKKVVLLVSSLVTLILLLIFLYFTIYPWVIIKTGVDLFNNPQKPEITYGEFPFQLVYEINGTELVLEDTLICEFVGFKTEGENGKYRQWRTYLKSGEERVTLLDLRGDKLFDEYGNQILELYFYTGNAEYYMGDWQTDRWKTAQDFRSICYMYQSETGAIGYSAYDSDQAWDLYSIKLIRWDVSLPIKNVFY